MSKLLNKCPYLKSKSGFKYTQQLIREDYGLQYNEHHQVEAVLEGETDLVKEANSHVNEVGLINAMRLAEAYGENPFVKFGKYEAGIPVAVDPNATLDEINQVITEQTKKYEEIAKTLGVSVAALQEALKTQGGLEKLIASTQAGLVGDNKVDEGGAE